MGTIRNLRISNKIVIIIDFALSKCLRFIEHQSMILLMMTMTINVSYARAESVYISCLVIKIKKNLSTFHSWLWILDTRVHSHFTQIHRTRERETGDRDRLRQKLRTQYYAYGSMCPQINVAITFIAYSAEKEILSKVHFTTVVHCWCRCRCVTNLVLTSILTLFDKLS